VAWPSASYTLKEYEMYVAINELEKDVLREIINIGLARAADSFADFSHEKVLLDVPDVKIIETKVFPEVVGEYNSLYTVIRSDIRGDLNGKTFMLFSDEDIQRIALFCLDCDEEDEDYDLQVMNLLKKISFVIALALCKQLEGILSLKLENEDPENIGEKEQKSVKHIIDDMPDGQPFMITIKTHFKKLFKILELPMLVVFDARSISRLLQVIRRNDLYDFKLLTKK
jgi:chemotaxis protein CheC